VLNILCSNNFKNTKKSLINVGVTGVGGAAGICCIKSLKGIKNIRIIGIDADPLSAGFKFVHSSFVIPYANDQKFIPELIKICKKEGITVLIPTVDEELLPISKASQLFLEVGTKVAVSDPQTIEITNDKWLLYQKLLSAGIPVPHSWLPESLEGMNFPVIVKPRRGRGSRDIYICQDNDDLLYALKKCKNPIIQEFLPGNEYTIDVLADLNGHLIVAVPRRRIEVKGGVSWKGKTEHNLELEELSKKIVEILKLRGPACIQARFDKNNKPKIFEINARIGGTTILTVKAGVNIPYLTVKLFLGKKIPSRLTFSEKFIVRYFEETYFSPDEVMAR